MAILIRGELLFVHVPRCGGTWLANMCKRLDIEHEVIRSPHAHVLPCHLDLDVDFAKSFTMVRNPWEWCESLWLYVMGRKISPDRWSKYEWHPLKELPRYWSEDYHVFADRMMGDGFASRMFGCYGRAVDFVVALPSASAELALLLDVSRAAIDAVPIVNSSRNTKKAEST